MLLQRLYQPYPQERQTALAWRRCFIYGLFVALFLLVFQPFGLHEPFPYKYSIIAGYGLTTTVVMLGWYLALPRFFPQLLDEARWVVWKEMLLTTVGITAIGVANFIYATWVHDFPLNWRGLGISLGMTFLVGIFPTAISILWRQQRLLHQNLAQAQQLNQQLPSAEATADDAPMLTLQDEAGKPVLTLQPQQFYYAVAAQNYVEVFHSNGKTLLRLSLKALANQLTAYSYLLRTHRSYLINIQQVTDVQGNAQGYRLTLANGTADLPVSRGRLADFQKVFSTLKPQ